MIEKKKKSIIYIYLLIGEGKLLITVREEFLVTVGSKIQPRGDCNVSPSYRLPNSVSFVCNPQPMFIVLSLY